MAMKLEQVVPFGRSFDEYVKMFSLSEADLQKSILSVADGPASFNAEGTERGYQIQSIDPLYGFSGKEIRDRFYAVLDGIITQIKATPNDWVWGYHASAEALKTHRIEVTERFYADYEVGKIAGRYRVGELPTLTDPDDRYELSLSSHFLFLYSDQLDAAFHLAAIDEMLRVSPEVRIFPLLTLAQEKSPYLEQAIAHLKASGHQCQIEKVGYELQPGGNEMLRICRSSANRSA
ncbi:MAG: SAM-dependent methyltransferase [Phormidesmis priestleyi]|uniref:SAM-dependent methyltransferase n=1 Tax=Phormidesmis priestleyi TaxID=268141 RepID=A0A2W4ZEE7_9CYAN|nr:MAG: SAM-dependent methyltransferase [Phormidesmis priestleyi]